MLHKRSIKELADILGVSYSWLRALRTKTPPSKRRHMEDVSGWDKLISQNRIEPRGADLLPRIPRSR
jgi:hypothetical protein